MLNSPMLADSLSDQYAFRPTGSTTAALIAILSDLTHLTNRHPYVHVIGLDFSKAFDTAAFNSYAKNASIRRQSLQLDR